MTEEAWEEDPEPTWLVKEREDALYAEQAYAKNEKVIYSEGQQVGNFIFISYNKHKNRATFQCPDCGRKFTYNVYAIKNKKRCKWYRFHKKTFS